MAPGILEMAGPACLALAADPILSMVDTAFVGQIGATHLAALGVDSAVFAAAFVVFNFLATATTPLIAVAAAAGDTDKVGRTIARATGIAAACGIGVFLALDVLADPILSVLGAGPETGDLYRLSREYLVVRAVAAPAVLISTASLGAFRGLQDMKTPLLVTVYANCINFCLDYFLIFGLGWDIKGAAAATTCAEWASAAAFLNIMWIRRDEFGISPDKVSSLLFWQDPQAVRPITNQQLSALTLASEAGTAASLDTASANSAPSRAEESEAGSFVKAGGAVLVRTLVLFATKTLASAVATRQGTIPMAAHQVGMQLWVFASLVVDSLAVTGQSLMAVHLGMGDIKEARATGDRLLQFGVVLGGALGIIYWITSPILLPTFTEDAAVREQVMALMPLIVVLQPLNAVAYVLDGLLVGASDFKYMAKAMVISATVSTVAFLAVEPMGWGIAGVWGGLGALMASRGLTLGSRYVVGFENLPSLPPAGAASPPTPNPEEASQAGWETPNNSLEDEDVDE
eukprot:jgi/Mesvir1/16468/Mv10029-RA.1